MAKPKPSAYFTPTDGIAPAAAALAPKARLAPSAERLSAPTYWSVAESVAPEMFCDETNTPVSMLYSSRKSGAATEQFALADGQRTPSPTRSANSDVGA